MRGDVGYSKRGTSDEVCGDAMLGQRAPVIAFKKMAAGVGEHFGL
jgi:hypothetical protein